MAEKTSSTARQTQSVPKQKDAGCLTDNINNKPKSNHDFLPKKHAYLRETLLSFLFDINLNCFLFQILANTMIFIYDT